MKVRVKGAMLDEVRRLSMRLEPLYRLKRQSKAIEHLANLKGRELTSAEIASYLGKDLKAYEKERLIAQAVKRSHQTLMNIWSAKKLTKQLTQRIGLIWKRH